MQYILLDIGYQEILNGSVVRYADLDGNTIEPPIGYGGVVIDANPPAPAWAVPDPAPVVPAPTSRLKSIHAFRALFTADEKRAIYTAAETSVDIRIWLDDLNTLKDDEIDLADPETVLAVTMLETIGLIGAGRAWEILNA